MKRFDELVRLEKIVNTSMPLLTMEVLNTVKVKDKTFPIISLCIGPDDKSLPTFGLFGGVHGLEKVGTHVILYYLESLIEQLKWDQELQNRFKTMRLVSIPMINPAGVYLNTRCNANGVDLMRNAPVEATSKTPFLVGGQTYSNKLPWYRGDLTKLEVESQALVDFVKAEMFESTFSLALDIHSGFGIQDRLWYPYAKTTDAFPLASKALDFAKLLDKSHPFHIYKMEPQSMSYCTNGDLWDYLFDLHYQKEQGKKTFIPWCLEMGSWTWIKKNPRQLFSSLGPFNPIKVHRYQRIMRRHYNLIDFFSKASNNFMAWSTT
jgi:hypothetical protein